jgi:hypothetical protein
MSPKRPAKPQTESRPFTVTARLIAQSLDEIANASDPLVVERILSNAQRLAVTEVVEAAIARLALLAPPRRRRAPARSNASSAWGPEVPSTSERAQPVAVAPQAGGAVIHVENAEYRGSTFSGYIELSGEQPYFQTRKGLRAHARLLWFGNRLPTRDPGILLENARVSEAPDYKGPVISNLAA